MFSDEDFLAEGSVVMKVPIESGSLSGTRLFPRERSIRRDKFFTSDVFVTLIGLNAIATCSDEMYLPVPRRWHCQKGAVHADIAISRVVGGRLQIDCS